jgi:hypothetical protein
MPEDEGSVFYIISAARILPTQARINAQYVLQNEKI